MTVEGGGTPQEQGTNYILGGGGRVGGTATPFYFMLTFQSGRERDDLVKWLHKNPNGALQGVFDGIMSGEQDRRTPGFVSPLTRLHANPFYPSFREVRSKRIGIGTVDQTNPLHINK